MTTNNAIERLGKKLLNGNLKSPAAIRTAWYGHHKAGNIGSFNTMDWIELKRFTQLEGGVGGKMEIGEVSAELSGIPAIVAFRMAMGEVEYDDMGR
jgi:hypothetical protein